MPSAQARAAARRRELGLTVLVISQSVLLFFVGPLVAASALPRAVAVSFAVGVVVLILSIVLAVVWCDRLAVVTVLVAAVVETLAVALRVMRPSPLTEALDFLAALLFFSALSAVIARVVFRSGRVTGHRIVGAIAIYLNIAFAFALGYRLIAVFIPHAFTGRIAPALDHRLFDYVYFSLSTLTTSGFGDIVPAAPLARALANLEAVIGQLFPATLLARLVTLELESKRAVRSRDHAREDARESA
ncbi:MAG TPA: ion channel [Candidatus Elarobacter sp.]|jgi:hypothetical protein